MSAFSLDEAIKKIKDDNAVKQLVGSLEKSLSSSSSVHYANGNSEMFKSFFDEMNTKSTTMTFNDSHSGALKNKEN
jgi:hypothetical protein